MTFYCTLRMETKERERETQNEVHSSLLLRAHSCVCARTGALVDSKIFTFFELSSVAKV